MNSYNHLLKLNHSAIVTLDSDLIIKDVVGASRILSHHQADSLRGVDYLSLVAPDYQNLVVDALKSLESYAIEYPLLQGQHQQWVRHQADHTSERGSECSFIIQAIEAPTHQSPVNEIAIRERTLLDTLPDMLIVIRQNGVITDFHTSSDTQSLGIHDDVIGQNISDTKLPQALLDETQLYLDVGVPDYVQSIEFSADDTTDNDYFEARLVRLSNDEIMILIRNMTAMKRVQDDLNQHIEDLNLVRQVNIELSADLDMEYVSPLALDAALRMTHAQAGYLAMRESEGGFKLLSHLGAYDEAYLQLHLTNQVGIIGRILKHNRAELILDVSQDPDYIPALEDTHAMMAIPLLSKTQTVGVLVLETALDDRFSRERFQFLQLITGRIAAFLDNAILHRQTKQHLEEVRELEQLKTDMIRIANHDLKNPIAGIMGYMELLRFDIKDKLSESERAYLDKIDVAAKKMQRITSGILSLERIEQLKDQQNLKTVNLMSLVNQSVSEQMDYAVRSEQILYRHLPDDNIYVQGDPLQLHEAISNLVQNAIKYSPPQSHVHVTLDIVGQKARVIVEDNGFGIPEDQQERLFSPFYRVTTRETRFIEGTGLGLHLVKNIIERHSGEMIFESTYGEGSTFGFTIPLMLPSLVG
ncbi:MAG: HAMP domain-containing sensor histidine kinase [Chloroflexota bacterium]